MHGGNSQPIFTVAVNNLFNELLGVSSSSLSTIAVGISVVWFVGSSNCLWLEIIGIAHDDSFHMLLFPIFILMPFKKGNELLRIFPRQCSKFTQGLASSVLRAVWLLGRALPEVT